MYASKKYEEIFKGIAKYFETNKPKIKILYLNYM